MATWNIDTGHTSADFAARHMMITTVRGGFKNVTGKLEYDPQNPAAASVEAVIDTTSMSSTGVADRDAHLKGADFLDIENYPTITFKSTKVEPNADGSRAKITGNLTVRNVTRSVVLDAELLGIGKSPWGDERAGFTGSVTINREDFGLTWNMALEAGGWLVAKDIKITLDVEAIRVAETIPA
ncbi:MAG: YceI family protein [Anaerolineae bacterium]|nr:YceI family protein [Anaerolineae bacterium]